jgi:hypothetical protein
MVEERNDIISRERILQSSTQSINTDVLRPESVNGQPVDDSRPINLHEEQENWPMGGDSLPEGQPDPNNNVEGGSFMMEGPPDIDMYVGNDDGDVDMVPMDLEDAFNDALEDGNTGPVPVEGVDDPIAFVEDPIAFVEDLPAEEDYNPYRDADQNDESENEELDDFEPAELDTPEHISADETVEMNTEEDDDAGPSTVDVFPRAGEVKERRQPRYAENVQYHMRNATRSVYHPFQDFQEYNLAIWLNELPLSKVDSFLQLPWVSSIHHCSQDSNRFPPGS